MRLHTRVNNPLMSVTILNPTLNRNSYLTLTSIIWPKTPIVSPSLLQMGFGSLLSHWRYEMNVANK